VCNSMADSESEKLGQNIEDEKASETAEAQDVKWGPIAALVGAVTLACWFLTDQVDGFWHFLFQWLTLCGLLFEVAWASIKLPMLPQKKWRVAIWSMYAVFCISVPLLDIWKLRNPNPFSFTVSRTIKSGPELKIRGSNLSFWLATPSMKDPQVYPLELLLFVRFTNHKATTCMIDLYGLEAEQNDGTWTTMPSIGLKQKTLYSGNDIHHANETETVEQSFNDAIDHKNIGPEETVEGWLFLVAPEQWSGGNIRIRITETDGSVYTKYVEVAAPNKAHDFSAQTASMKIHPEEKDLSGFQRVVPVFNMP
jgi:hypothetical protein